MNKQSDRGVAKTIVYLFKIACLFTIIGMGLPLILDGQILSAARMVAGIAAAAIFIYEVIRLINFRHDSRHAKRPPDPRG